jgi:hypothetical protein
MILMTGNLYFDVGTSKIKREPKKGRAELHITVDAELLKQIKLLAVEQETTYGRLIEEGMKSVLEKYTTKK